MRGLKNRLKSLEKGRERKIIVAIGRGEDGYDTDYGIMSREEVNRLEEQGHEVNRIEGDFRGI